MLKSSLKRPASPKKISERNCAASGEKSSSSAAYASFHHLNDAPHLVFTDAEEFSALLQSDATVNRRPIIEKTLGEMLMRTDDGATYAILNSAVYFDQIGDTVYSLEYCLKGLERALKSNDELLQRKAHNIAGVIYASICDFDSSFTHFEKAFSLSTKQSEFYQFAVLCNIVSTLEVAGLTSYAREISMKLVSFPSDTIELKDLHLQNAVNGGTVSYLTRDYAALLYFNNIAQGLIHDIAVTPLMQAYVDSLNVSALLIANEENFAYQYVEKKLKERKDSANFRLNSLLFIARAECALKLGSDQLIIESTVALLEILPQAEGYSIHEEETLRCLIKLYSTRKEEKERLKGLDYVNQLTSLVVRTKHKQFFIRLSQKLSPDCGATATITRSSYRLPQAIVKIPRVCDVALFEDRELFVDEDDEIQIKRLSFYDPIRRGAEARLRSSAFNIAEDWSVAAEYKMGGDGKFCARVGLVARMIGVQIQLAEEAAVILEMACRLYHVGHIAFDESLHSAIHEGTLDSYLVREHTIIGESLLDLSGDPVMAMAAKVAKYHHAWWNGCGYPDSIYGLAIPLEARICAVADYVVSLLYPYNGHEARDLVFVARQLRSMAGVQFDPKLTAAMVTLMSEEDCFTTQIGGEFAVHALLDS